MRRRGIGPKKVPVHLIVWLIFLIAFSIRIWGNTFGLPYFFHPDEPKLTIPVWQIVERGQWNPGNFFYPTGFIYLLFFGFKLISFFGLTFHSYQADLIILHWLGRFYSALLGAGSVWLLYGLSKRLHSSFIGIVSALFLGLNFTHLKYSHYATPDIASLFFILFSLFLLITSIKTRKGRQFLAGFFGGIAIGIKYSAWPIILPILIRAFLPDTKEIQASPQTRAFAQCRLYRIGAGIFFCLLGFLLTTPFAIIDLRHFLSSFIEVLIIPRSYWLGMTHLSPFYYFCGFKPIAGAGVVFIFSIVGLFSRLKNWSVNDTLFASFFIPYIILASLSVEKIDRFFLPATVLFIFWAGAGINSTALVLGRLKGRRYFILFILAVLLSICPAFKAIKYIQALEKRDNRVIASEWIKENIPPHSNLAFFRHPWANPPLEHLEYKATFIPLIYKNKDLDRERFKLRFSRNRVIAGIVKRVFRESISPEIFQARIDRLTSLEEFTLSPLSYFQERGADYIVISGFFKEDLLDKDTAIYFPKLSFSSHSFFNELEKETRLIYSLSPVKGFGKDFALSPSIEIYKLN